MEERERRKDERKREGEERERLPVCRFQTSPCAGSQRLRVYRQNARGNIRYSMRIYSFGINFIFVTVSISARMVDSDFRVSGLPHAVVKEADNFSVLELVKKIESLPHREALKPICNKITLTTYLVTIRQR